MIKSKNIIFMPRGNSLYIFKHFYISLFRLRCCRPIDVSWRCHFSCWTRSSSIPHSVHGSMVIRHFLHLHQKEPHAHSSASIFFHLVSHFHFLSMFLFSAISVSLSSLSDKLIYITQTQKKDSLIFSYLSLISSHHSSSLHSSFSFTFFIFI